MLKKVAPLTDTQIKNLKPKSKRYKKSDIFLFQSFYFLQKTNFQNQKFKK